MIRIDSVIEALFAGAAAGAAVIGTAFALAMIAPAIAAGGIPSAELPYGLLNLALFSGYALIAAFILFLIGMALLGLPVWFFLHRAGRRSRLDAAVLGGGLSTVLPAGLVIATDGLGDPSALASLVAIALAGGIAGLIFHRVAYRRP